MPRTRFRPPLFAVVVCALAAVAVIPVAAVTLWFRSRAEASVLQAARDKNQLLSENLATPIGEHLEGATQNLRLLARLYGRAPRLIGFAVRAQKYFVWVGYVREDARMNPVWSRAGAVTEVAPAPALRRLLQPFFGSSRAGLTGLELLHGRPVVLVVHPVAHGLLVGSLDLAPIRALCAGIHYGRSGHCVVTDQFGRVVQHPNRAWVAHAKSIRNWPIVAAGLRGNTGVQKFYSPFMKKDMMAGYAAVPGFGWTVLTPQPLSEFTARATHVVDGGIWAGVFGLCWALAVGGVFVAWLLQPILLLEADMGRLRKGDFRGLFRRRYRSVPRELDVLRLRSRHMALGVRAALRLRDGVNVELERRVQVATAELRSANVRLERETLVDELTQLGNRRMLADLVERLGQRPASQYLPVCALLFDIDYFKQVNDSQGHGTGDELLIHVARILEREIRDGDQVLRYAGDEFLVIMTQCDLHTAEKRAEAMRRAVFEEPLPTSTGALLISLSVGVAATDDSLNAHAFQVLVAHADKAMYRSKRLGRNRVSRVLAE